MYCFLDLHLHQMVAVADGLNIAVSRLLQRVGMRQEARLIELLELVVGKEKGRRQLNQRFPVLALADMLLRGLYPVSKTALGRDYSVPLATVVALEWARECSDF